MIGDPRGDATSLNGLNNLGNGYKPAGEDADNYIAPIIKIASSYGKTVVLNYENAQKRCAAYQENGYPAGRWRLPTKAEINFLMNLSDLNKIPTLFNPQTSFYWAAGHLGFNGDDFTDYTNRTTATGYTRCVYDVWYWGDGQHQLTSWNGYKTDYDSTYDE